MKKLISLITILTLLLTALVACKKSDGGENGGDTPSTDDGAFVIPEGLSGNDVIKLLLASQRLDSQLLKNEGDIFENGVEVMQTLASRAKANLRGATYISKTHEAERGGKVEIDGNTFTWSGFAENCNSYDYFENITQNIVSSAEQGAKLIDNTKKYVRIVDKWVSIGEEKYYLHVDKNSETIYSLISGQLNICRRHRNDSGENVYEIYISNENNETRMYYVPGERYELSQNFGTENDSHYFVADNSKGFWETMVLGAFPDHYNLSFFVMKNDICYDALVIPETQSIHLLKTVSSDKQSDILFFMDSDGKDLITLHLGAFDGFDSVEINATPDKVASSWGPDNENAVVVYDTSESEPYAATTGLESATVNLTNGNKISADMTYAGGNVTVQRVLVTYGSQIYTSELELVVNGDSDEEIFTNLKAFLDETGLECKRDIDTILGGIRRAYFELDSLISYYRWNSNHITPDGLEASMVIEDGIFANFRAMYDAIKNAEVIDFSDKEAVDLNISFAQIVKIKTASAKFENMSITVEGIELTVNDTTLYVENEEYTVGFALVSTSDEKGGLIHPAFTNDTKIVYTGTDSFTAGSANAGVTLPELSPGSYTVVAYISTSDSVRASQYVPISFTEIDTKQIDLGDTMLVPSQNEKGEIVLTYVENIDVSISLASPEDLDYASLRDILAEEAYKYGVASDVPVEKQNADSEGFSALTGDETVVESGVYRLAYSVQNGDVTLNGYIYAEYLAPETKQ